MFFYHLFLILTSKICAIVIGYIKGHLTLLINDN